MIKFFSTVLVLFFSTWTFAFDKGDAYKVISIEGEEIPRALMMDIEDLSLSAVFDGEVEPIPYQIDEYNIGGAVYFPDWDVGIAGKAEEFNKTDRILFLYKDAGPRLTDQKTDGTVVAEIELTGEDGDKRYAYLMSGSRIKADEQYVRYSSEEGLVETDFYGVTYDAANHLIWKDFTVYSYLGEHPLDEMKINWNSGVLTSLSRIHLTNENIIAEPKGVNVGPIRNTTQLLLTLYWLEVPLLKASLQLHHYPRSIIYDMRVLTPSIRRSALVDPQLTLSLDGNQLVGSTIQSALGQGHVGIVDGELSPSEKAIVEAGVNRTQNWLYVSTKKEMDILAFFDFLGETDEPLSIAYQDNRDIQEGSERFKGQLPNIGYHIGNFPETGLFGFAVSLYIRDNFTGNPESFNYDVRSLPDISIN